MTDSKLHFSKCAKIIQYIAVKEINSKPQIKSRIPTQVPLFWHGSSLQKSISSLHVSPVKPTEQEQLNPFTRSVQTPLLQGLERQSSIFSSHNIPEYPERYRTYLIVLKCYYLFFLKKVSRHNQKKN